MVDFTDYNKVYIEHKNNTYFVCQYGRQKYQHHFVAQFDDTVKSLEDVVKWVNDNIYDLIFIKEN